MKKTLYFILFILLAGFHQFAVGQDRLPVREYRNPQELVVLSADVPFQDALGILEELSVEYKNKIFVNQTEFEGPIGMEIPQMHWEDALNRIAEYNNMYVTEYSKYYEIQNIPLDRTQEDDEDVPEEEQIRVDFQSREIKISATFFQGDRSLLREIGVDWSAVQNGKVRVTTNTTADITRNDYFNIDANWGEIFSTGSWDITSLFAAFEESGNGEVLSSPSIKVLDGREGNIQVGQDFSIKQRDFAGNITDEFFSTGTILTVTPHIFYSEEDGTPFIYMTVATERSTAQPDPISTIVNKQEATTELLMLSGESAVIAGLYETEVTTTRRGIPILKDLPPWFLGLRYLFGYDSTEHTVKELVVLIKAELVPTLQERFDEPFRERPELLDETRRQFQEEIRQMQEQQTLEESMDN